MANRDGFTLVGLDEVMGNMRRLSRGMQKEVKLVMNEEGNAVKTASMKRTPVKVGVLRGSHKVDTKTPGDNVITTVSVGDAAATYAKHVHENLKARHRVGEAKFLEKSLNERRPIAGKIAARIDLNRAGRG